MARYVVTDDELIETADAIREKTGDAAPIEWAGGTGFAEAISSIPSGGGGSEDDDVVFIDYDGTVVQSYSAEAFAKLTALPANPTHEGLTAQGWNWSLEDAQSYVAKYGMLTVGQMYITDDGKTRIHIRLEEGRLAPFLGFAINGSADVDWGDGSEHSTVTGTDDSTVISTQHSYAAAGEYTIVLDVTDGTVTLMGTSTLGSMVFSAALTSANSANRTYQNAIWGVEIGENLTIGAYAFRNCIALAGITIPASVTSIGEYAFDGCSGLTSITIPASVTSIGAYAFDGCSGLTSITIPASVTTIGTYAFRNCIALAGITIPDGVTSIGAYALSGCSALTSITIPASVTTIGTYALSGCTALASITIPDSVKALPVAIFSGCTSLRSVTIPNSVTLISNNAFSDCYSLTSISIPASASLGNSVFSSCVSLGFLRFERPTPTYIANKNTFSNLPTDCIIYVPKGSLSAYTSAANYPSSSTYTYVEYDV